MPRIFPLLRSQFKYSTSPTLCLCKLTNSCYQVSNMGVSLERLSSEFLLEFIEYIGTNSYFPQIGFVTGRGTKFLSQLSRCSRRLNTATNPVLYCTFTQTGHAALPAFTKRVLKKARARNAREEIRWFKHLLQWLHEHVIVGWGWLRGVSSFHQRYLRGRANGIGNGSEVVGPRDVGSLGCCCRSLTFIAPESWRHRHGGFPRG